MGSRFDPKAVASLRARSASGPHVNATAPKSETRYITRMGAIVAGMLKLGGV